MKSVLLTIFLLTTLAVYCQFPSIQWEYPLDAPAFGSSAAADMDKDGYYEIVFTTYTNDGRAHCLNAEDGSVKWTFDLGGCGDVAPLIYDVNGDDTLDVIINGSCHPTIFCLNGATGRLQWSRASGGGDSPPTAADMDNDQKPEVLFGNFSGEIRILNGEDGSTDKVILADIHHGVIQTAPTLVDIDGNGSLEILAANYFNTDGLYVWAFDYASGDVIWTHTITDPSANLHAYHGGAVADIDGDGKPEYVVGSGAGFVLALNVEDGSELWKIDMQKSNFMAITIADLDQDGQLEVIFNNNGTFDERIWILNGLDGSVEWSYPIVYTAFRGMAVSDIDGNGKLDLVSGHFLSTLRVVEPYEGLIWEMDLSEQLPPNLPYHTIDVAPLIADFDKNGTSDIFVVAGYGTYTPDAQNTGKAFLIEAGEGNCPEWLTFRYDSRRTAYLPPEQVQEECATTTVKDASDETNISGISIYPNPTRGIFQLAFNSPRHGRLKIEIIDQAGVTVFRHQGIIWKKGSEKATLVLPPTMASGLYFARILIDDQLFDTCQLVRL